jgi:putative spermidine/putrescine transport system ATP-binding protein
VSDLTTRKRAAGTGSGDAGSGSPPRLRLESLAKRYPGAERATVDQVDLEVPAGQLLALLGPSGCGKTTILRMIAGLIEPTSGRILIGERDITRAAPQHRQIGMVFQSYALFPHLDVRRNVAFGLEVQRTGRAEREQRVADALSLVHLEGLGGRRVSQLSGGQQQRVALARALVTAPQLLLLDEPLSNLDAVLRIAMRDEIRGLQRRTGTTTVFVTHDRDEALTMADQVAVLADGRVQQVGTPADLYERPASPFVAGFLGPANLVPAIVEEVAEEAAAEQGAGLAVLRTGTGEIVRARSAPGLAGRAVNVLVRPHQLRLDRLGPQDDAARQDPGRPAAGRSGGSLTGTVTECSYAGDRLRYLVKAADRDFRVEIPTGAAAPIGPGETVLATWAAEDAWVVPAPEEP